MKPTQEQIEQMGIIELRTNIAQMEGWNPRNLSPYIITTMDRAECEAYILHGALPAPGAKPARDATLKAGAKKYFGKGGDPTGAITMPEASEPNEDGATPEELKFNRKISVDGGAQVIDPTREKSPPAAAPAAAPAPGMDALLHAITAAVKAEVLASLPPPPKQELDADAVRKITDDRLAGVTKTMLDTTREVVAAAVKEANAKADEASNKMLADVMRALSTADTPKKARASAALSKSTGKGANAILDRFLSLCPVGSNPGNHVLVVGPSGTGKTYQARNFAKLHDWYTEAPIGLHKYMEPHHISGSAAPNDEGTFAFVSGAFRDGFLAASKGKTACILLDEILRASPEMQESLLTTLDPIPTPKGTVYRYRSGKPVKTPSGEWTQEVIEAPTDKLTIIATANIGTNYGVFSVDEAFWKRFRVVRIERNGTDERQIIANAANHLGAQAIKACIIILDETRRAVKDGTLQYPACVRTITRCAEQSESTAELKVQLEALCTQELTGWTEDGAILQLHADTAAQIAIKALTEL